MPTFKIDENVEVIFDFFRAASQETDNISHCVLTHPITVYLERGQTGKQNQFMGVTEGRTDIGWPS